LKVFSVPYIQIDGSMLDMREKQIALNRSFI
jgi:hypothetical protein